MDMKTMLLVNQRPQYSLVSRFTAGAFGDHNAAEAFSASQTAPVCSAEDQLLPHPLPYTGRPKCNLGQVIDCAGTAGWIRTTDLLIHSQAL